MERASNKIISVSSSSKKAGKSSLASFLVRELGADFGLKVSSGGAHTTSETVITDPEVIDCEGTDTGHLKEAGAKLVLWVNTEEGMLEGEITRALDMFPSGGLLLVEGNSAVPYLNPDFAVFLMSVPFEDFKPSANLALLKADLVLVDEDSLAGKTGKDHIEEQVRIRSQGAKVNFYRGKRGQELAWFEVARTIREKLKD